MDNTKYNLDAPQNIPSNINTYMRQILPTENHLIFLLPTKEEKGNGILLAVLQDDSLEINNTSSSPYFMTFHRNHAYISYRDSLYIPDINDFRRESFYERNSWLIL